MSSVQVSERVDTGRVPVLQKATGSFRPTLGGRLRFVSVGVRALRVGVQQPMHLLTTQRPPNKATGVNSRPASPFESRRALLVESHGRCSGGADVAQFCRQASFAP